MPIAERFLVAELISVSGKMNNVLNFVDCIQAAYL